MAIEDRFAEVNGIRLHYLVAGKGDPVILLHGYAQTSHMWRPLIVPLAKDHTAIAPDLRGFGQSSTPPGGYDENRRYEMSETVMLVHGAWLTPAGRGSSPT
jgi:pimeloyl-ACP methyl ester carboxylesterase